MNNLMQMLDCRFIATLVVINLIVAALAVARHAGLPAVVEVVVESMTCSD